MGYNNSGLILTDSENIATDYTGGEELIQFLYDNLTSAGWTAQKIMAHTRFILTLGGIVAGDTVTVGGHLFTFISGPDEPFGVHILGSDILTLGNLGEHTKDDIQWVDYEVGLMPIGFSMVPYIEWQVPDYPFPADPTFDGNLEVMQVSPPGGLGIFDYNPESVTGLGRSYEGGFIFTSLPTPFGGVVSIKVQTTNTGTADITVKTADDIANFSGIQVANNWNLIVNPYQFVMFVTGTFTAGYFLLVSSLYPYSGLTQANFISGPVNPVIPSGSNRVSLSGIGNRYYVDVSGGYFSASSSEVEKVPNFCFPGWGSGISSIQKLGNKISGQDILRDNGRGIPFEAFVGARLTEGGAGSDKIYIIGSLWDAYISSVYGAPDAVELINGKTAVVMMSQVGSSDVSRGSLVMQTEL